MTWRSFARRKAYGFPLPWYYEWCLCERDEPPVSVLNCAVNIVLCAVVGFALAKIVHRVKNPRVLATMV